MEFSALQNLANQAFTWIGFGTVLGLLALVVVPPRDAESNVASIMMATVGALIACALLKYFYRDELILPMSARGFLVGVTGSIALLVFYRVLGSYWQPESEGTGYRGRLAKRRRKRQWLEESAAGKY